MKIQILSREDAERLINTGFQTNTAVISFYDPVSKWNDSAPIDFSTFSDRVFQVAVHDADIDSLDEYGYTLDTFFPEAPSLASFIVQAIADGYDILCQCEYGQSRSAACAAAIYEYYDKSGIKIFSDYRYCPNQLIFNKLMEALIDEDK